MVPRVGQKIGPYEILGRLGSGGMGLVFSAWDARLHRDVAIKLLKDEFLTPTMRSRFLGEARAASRLNHPNICTIFDIGEEQDCPYLVMELLKGDTLRSRMQKGALPVDVVLQVGTQVADALSVAHEHGIVHRDIKPANVVLVDKPNGTFQTKVLDFGLAKVDLGGLDSHSGLTTTGMTVGTVSYMSPEQARGELLDGRSDLFSLGVLLYEMSTGKLPFDGATSALVFVQLLNHPPESLRSLNASVPRAFEQVINTCLQKDRNERYQTAQDLVRALYKTAQNVNGGEKSASWFTKFTGGLKRESAALPIAEPVAEQKVSGDSPPLQMTSEEAFLRPFKPARRPSSQSRHYEPVNAPYTGSGEEGSVDPFSPGDVEKSATESQGIASGSAADSESADDNNPVAPSKPSNVHVPFPDWIEERVEAPSHDEVPIAEERSPPPRRWRILLGSLLTCAILAATVGIFVSKKHMAVTQLPPTVTLATFSNNTGDSTLGNVIASGLELSLQQSQWVSFRTSSSRRNIFVSELPVRGDGAFAAAQEAAKLSGAASFLVGEIHMEGAAYSLSLRIFDTAKGTAIGSCASTAVSRERIFGAIDGLAISLRSALGEPGASISAASLPLSKEATENMEALLAYSMGDRFRLQGHLLDAMYAYEHATSLDPQFAEAHLRLAALYEQQHAEVNAADAANRATATPNGADHIRLMASGLQALLAADDLDKAAALFAELTKRFPKRSEAFTWLAKVQRLQGNYAESLSNATQAVLLEPSDEFALEEQKLALLASDHADDAVQVAIRKKSNGSGMLSPGDQLAMFAQRIEGPAELLAADRLDSQMAQAELSDATGQLRLGLEQWRTTAQHASAISELASSAAYALARASLDRALIGDCRTVQSLGTEASAYEPGSEALFAFGMASGLCGNLDDLRVRMAQLQKAYPHSSRVIGFYTSDLNAILQWKSGAFADALVTLHSAEHYDAVSWNRYLRGQVYLAEKQPQPAAVELQAFLRHPGELLLLNAEAPLITQLALARAFAANGDLSNAAHSYQKVQSSLRHADPDNPMLAEARLASPQ